MHLKRRRTCLTMQPLLYIQTVTLTLRSLLTSTVVAWVRRPSASVCVWFGLSVCLSVCPHDNSKMNDHRIAYRWYMTLGSKSQRSRVGLELQKHIEGDRVAGVSYAVSSLVCFAIFQCKHYIVRKLAAVLLYSVSLCKALYMSYDQFIHSLIFFPSVHLFVCLYLAYFALYKCTHYYYYYYYYYY